MFDNFISRCKELGKEPAPELTGDALSTALAKIIVNEKVLDDDAFELAAKCYHEGRASMPIEAEEGA
jgi:hypothetical protein